MQLETGKTIQGKAGTNSAITYTITGDLKTTGVDSYQVIVQGQLSTSAATPLYTVPASSQLLISTIKLSNTTASAVTGVTVYVGGSAATNQTDAFTMPASGNATSKAGAAFVVTDINGATSTTTAVVLSTDATGTLANGILPMTLNTVNANVGSFGTSSQVASFTVNAKGLTTTASNTAIRDASTSQSGFESAAQFNTTANQWYDVTNYGVTISNSGATNTANMNTLIQTTAGTGARFFFPQTGANYPFNGAIVVTQNGQKFMGTGDFNSVLFDGSTTDDLFRVQDGVNKPEFYDLGMWVTVVKVSGSAINFGTVTSTGNPQANVYRCGFNTFGGTWFNGIVYNGSRGGEVSKCEDVVMNGFTNYGIALIGNTSTPATTSALYLDNVLMNGQKTASTGAVAGVFTQQAGAVQFSNSDIISCTNNYLAGPITSSAQVVASVYAINTYFDHSNGSCVKFGGTQPIVRCKFVACSMTINTGGNYSAIEFANTAANPPADIDIQNCNVQNTFNNVGTSNGILIVGVGNCMIQNNNINGFTNNIQVTPATPAGSARLIIMGNNIGPGTVSATTSTVDILLNAGATTYGLVKIQDNNFNITNAFQTGSTTAITDNSTILVGGGQKFISGNTGRIASPAAPQTAGVTLPITTLTKFANSIFLPANSLRVGTVIVADAILSKITATADATSTTKITYNTADTGGTVLQSMGLAGTAAVGVNRLKYTFSVRTIGAGGTATTDILASQLGVTGVTNNATQYAITAAAAINTTVDNYLGLWGTTAVANDHRYESVYWTVVQQ